MTVWRVQDSQGRGPFAPGFTREWADAKSEGKRGYTLESDFGPEIVEKLGPHWGCACRSRRQLERWFSKRELARLLRMGFSIVKIEAERIVAESDRQLVFVNSRPLVETAREVWP